MRTTALLGLALALLVSAPVLAQEGAASASSPGADAYTQRVQQGIEMLVAGDGAGASAAFRQAIALDESRPQAAFYLATIQRMGGNLEEALAGFRRSAELASSSGQPRWQARALSAVAMTLERMEGRVEEAREAWQEYTRFADAHPTIARPQLGRARLQAIDMMNEQEQVYFGVRERIAERERLAAEGQDGRRRSR